MKIPISTVFVLMVTFPLVHSSILADHQATEERPIPRYKDCSCDGYDICSWSNENTRNISCGPHFDVYINCEQSVCSFKSCPPDQIFNFTTLRCESCRPGFAVERLGGYAYCGCPKGTMEEGYDCVPCNLDKPGGLDWPDCYCQRLMLDYRTEPGVCRECPNDTTLHLFKCQCNDPKMFYNIDTMSCQECPGVLMETYHPLEGEHRYICICQGENEMFNEFSGSCVTCPPDSEWINNGSAQYCRCLDDHKGIDLIKNICVSYDDNSIDIEK